MVEIASSSWILISSINPKCYRESFLSFTSFGFPKGQHIFSSYDVAASWGKYFIPYALPLACAFGSDCLAK
jgi:hypothetical protein